MARKFVQPAPVWVGDDITDRPVAASARPGAQFKVGAAVYEVGLVSGVRTWKRVGTVEQVTLGAAGLARTLTIDTQVDEQQRGCAVQVFLAPASGRTLTLAVTSNGRALASTATCVWVSKAFDGPLVVTLTADDACTSTYEVWVDGKPVASASIAFTS
jgi:hypothetical protein